MTFFQAITTLIRRAVQFAHPSIPIGGLEVSDTFLRFVRIHGDRAAAYSVRLAPGTLDNGKILDSAHFLSGLRNLAKQLLQAGEELNVIVTLASSHISTQVVRLPAVPLDQYEAALDLNLRSSSPLDTNLAYYDAQPIDFNRGNEAELLAAFVDRALIDALVGACTETGFSVVSIEFPALSVARVFATLGLGYDSHTPRLLISVVPDGADFLIVRDGHLLFHYWNSWKALRDETGARAINLAAFQSSIGSALQKTLNFYTARWGGAITEVVFVTPGIEMTLRQLFESQFKLHIIPFAVSQFSELAASFSPALGAALRGAISRREDTLISLAPEGTELAYRKMRFLHFVIFWRYTFAVLAVSIFSFFLMTDVWLARLESESAVMLAAHNGATLADASALRAQALAFNTSVDFVSAALRERGALSPIFRELSRTTGNDIILKRIASDARDESFSFTGHAGSEFSAINFKNTLARNARFTNVSLPFSRIMTEGTGVAFQLTFRLKESSS